LSAADIPPSLRKKTSSYYDTPNPESQGLIDLSELVKTSNAYSAVSSILQKKSDVCGFADTSRHTIESQDNGNGIKSLSIVKRQKVPVSQAIAVVSAQKMVSTPIFRPATQTVGNVANVSQNQFVSNVSQNKNMSKKKNNPFGDTRILEAKYTEMVDEIVNDMESSGKYKVSSRPEFKKAPTKNARDLGLAERSKSVEPKDFAAISDTKSKVKENLKKRPDKLSRNNRNDPNWLIDQMFEGVVGVAKVAGKTGRAIAKEGFHATKTGIRAVNEICEEVSKNPNIQRIKQQQGADMRHMRSMRKRAKDSIAAVGNKRNMSTGSLVTQHGFGTRTTTTIVAPTYASSSQYGGIYCKYERGLGGRPEIHFYSTSGRRVTHTKVSLIIPKKIITKLKQEAKSRIFGQPVQANTASSTPVKPIKTVNKPAFNTGTKRVLNRPKTTTRSGLVHRNKSGVV
jgi:hypothetical protein